MCSPQKRSTNNITNQHCHHWPKPLLLQQPWSPSYLDNIVSSSNWLNTQAALLVAQSTKLPYLFIDDAWVTGFLVNSFITSNNSNWNHKCGVFKLLQFVTTASRPTKVYGWKFTHHGWVSNHYLENQPLVGKPTTLWLEILPSSQPHRYHNSALYILFDKGKVEENSSPWNRPLKDGEWRKGTTRLHSAFFNLHCFASSFM